MKPQTKIALTLPLLVFVVTLLFGATASFLIYNGKLQSSLDGNGQAITNVARVVLTNGDTIAGSGGITNGQALGTGFNIYAGSSTQVLRFNAITNGDSSIGLSSNANLLSVVAQNITEAKQSLSDVTTLDVSTSLHGYIPKMLSPSNSIALNWNGAASWKVLTNILKAGTNIALHDTNGIVTIDSSGGSGTGSVPLTNTVWVAKNGSDSTGARGDPAKAFLTLGAAKTNAVSGDTIFVCPGTYDEKNLLKNGVNWHFFNGAIVDYTGADNGSLFDDGSDGANANVTSRITGHGVFKNHGSSAYYVIAMTKNSSIWLEGLSMTSDDYVVDVTGGTNSLTLRDIYIAGTNRNPVLINASYCTALFDRCKLEMTDTDNNGAALYIYSTNTSITLRDSVLFGNSAATTPVPIKGAVAGSQVRILGGLTLNLAPTDANATLVQGENRWYAGDTPYNDVVYHPTNTAPLNIDSTDFALDTNYTNGVGRAYVSACLSLVSTNGADAIVSLYLDQDADTTFEITGITAQLGGAVPTNYWQTNVVQLGAWVQPGGVFTFTNLSVAPATASVNAGSSQWVKQ